MRPSQRAQHWFWIARRNWPRHRNIRAGPRVRRFDCPWPARTARGAHEFLRACRIDSDVRNVRALRRNTTALLYTSSEVRVSVRPSWFQSPPARCVASRVRKTRNASRDTRTTCSETRAHIVGSVGCEAGPDTPNRRQGPVSGSTPRMRGDGHYNRPLSIPRARSGSARRGDKLAFAVAAPLPAPSKPSRLHQRLSQSQLQSSRQPSVRPARVRTHAHALPSTMSSAVPSTGVSSTPSEPSHSDRTSTTAPLIQTTNTEQERIALALIDKAESTLLEELMQGEYDRTSIEPVKWEKQRVRLPTIGYDINTVMAGDVDAEPLVVVHGWGAGLAYFGKNLAALTRKGYRVYLMDWLGFGASSHPPFPLHGDSQVAEEFFLSSMEEWVEQMQTIVPNGRFSSFHLCGHSLGAFLAVKYTIRVPHRVRNLVLGSPVGVPEPPNVRGPPPNAPLLKRLLFNFVYFMWERHYTPQMLVRNTPEPIGRYIAASMSGPRFSATTQQCRIAIDDYFYRLWCAPPSAEHSLSTVLVSGAYAKRPLEKILHDVPVPVVFTYGDIDWMNSTVARRVAPTMTPPAVVHTIDHSGHHVYFDNPDQFNEIVHKACVAARA